MCLNLEPVTYRVKEMPPGDSNTFSSLYSRLSPAAPSLNAASLSAAQQFLSVKVENPEILGAKRLSAVDEAEECTTKRAKTSSISPSLGHVHVQTPSCTSTSMSATYTVTTSVPLFTNSKVSFTRSDLSLSSVSSSCVTSSQSAQGQGQSSTVNSLLPTSTSQNVNLTSKFSSTSTSIRSPYIHISCPTTKQQTVSYSLAGPRRQSPAAVRAGKNQPIPFVITQPAGVSGTTTQVLPYIISSTSGSLSGLQQKVILAAPEGQTLRTGTVPLVLAGGQQSSSATVLLTSAPGSGQKAVVRPPAHVVQESTDIILSSSPSRSQKAAGTSTSSVFTSSSSVSTVQASTLSTNSQSLLSMIKPTEVKVSRQLFHETTSPSSSSSSALTNGRGSVKMGENSFDLPCVLQQFHGTSSVTLSSNHSLMTAGTAAGRNHQQTSVKTSINKSLVTPPSGQQFATSPSKSVLSSHMTAVDDISVLAAMELAGDDLGPLNTSTDSLNGSISGCAHLTDSIMTDIAAAPTVSHSPDESGSLVDMVQVVGADSQTFGPIHTGSDGRHLMNGSCQSYMKAKDGSIITQASSLSSPGSPSPLTLSETSDFVHIPTKSQKLISRDCQDSGVLHPVTYQVTSSGALSGHSLKSDINMSPSIMMSDISSLPFTEQGAVQIIDNSSNRLGGMSPILTCDELHENSVHMLSDATSGQEVQDLDGQAGDLGAVSVTDSLTGEEDGGQLLLSEGASIYQTDDGTFIIHSANGNTYQLQGAQGLPLETVQALLSGTLDQLVGDSSSDGTNTQLH